MKRYKLLLRLHLLILKTGVSLTVSKKIIHDLYLEGWVPPFQVPSNIANNLHMRTSRYRVQRLAIANRVLKLEKVEVDRHAMI